MKFRQSNSASYFSRKHQLRMLRMVGLLALVVIAAQAAANPEMWRWFFQFDEKKQQPQEQTAKRDVDYSVRLDNGGGPLKDDEFRATAEEPLPPAVAEKPKSAKRTTSNGGDANEQAIEIDRDVLAPVRDDFVGIRRNEAEAFYAVVAKAQEIPTNVFAKVGRNDIDYTVLMTDSAQFRGTPVSVTGTVRRLRKIDATANRSGVRTFYDAWLFTKESGQHPYRLVCSRVPLDIPLEVDIEVPAKFTGYFFKRQGYASEGGYHKAPVLIGNSLEVIPPKTEAEQKPRDLGFAPYLVGLAVVIAGALGITLWRFSVSDRKFASGHIKRYTAASDETVRALNSLPAVDPNAIFQQLAEESEPPTDAAGPDE